MNTRWDAVALAPRLSDLRDAICFVERHGHLSTTPFCDAGRAQAYRIRQALIARYQYRADKLAHRDPSDPYTVRGRSRAQIVVDEINARSEATDDE